MNDEHHSSTDRLSPEGLARKQAMLAELEPAVRWRGRRRVAGIAGAAVSPLVLLALVWTALAGGGGAVPSPEPSPSIAASDGPLNSPGGVTPADEDAPSAPTPLRNSRVVYVVNSPGTMERLSSRADASRVHRLTDDELLAALSSNGLPAGLVRREGRVQLAFHTAGLSDDDRTR